MADPFRLAFDVWAAARAPLSSHLAAADIEVTEELLADRNGAATPRIMVFGTYNAGKSTLINALVGEEVARVADHPETDRVTSYNWRGFLLDDTPGIDAPIEHEQVTREHLDSSDAVLFVLATDGTIEEQRSIDEIIKLVRVGKPIRVILNNKSGFRPDSPDFLSLRDRLAENLRHAAAGAGIEDIESRTPIRLVNAASGLRGRREGKSALLANSGMLELEADITEFYEATGKAQMARTVCRRMAKQIELALACLPRDDGMHPFREAVDAVTAERARLTAVLDQASQQVAAVFQADISHAMSNRESQGGPVAANKAVDMVTIIIDRELRKTQRVFSDIENAIAGEATAIHSISGSDIPLPEGTTPDDGPKGGGFRISDAANLLTSQLNQLDREAMVGGFMAAKQAFPSVFKGLGPAFFERVVPFIGPAVQTVTGIYDAYTAHHEAERDFEREKSRRLALMQQIADAGHKMRWVLSEQCLGII
jgi:GTPase SAR1 family protein